MQTKLGGEFRVLKVQNILHANFFMFTLLISNHTVFLIEFGINLHLGVFQKAEIALAEAAHAISTF